MELGGYFRPPTYQKVARIHHWNHEEGARLSFRAPGPVSLVKQKEEKENKQKTHPSWFSKNKRTAWKGSSLQKINHSQVAIVHIFMPCLSWWESKELKKRWIQIRGGRFPGFCVRNLRSGRSAPCVQEPPDPEIVYVSGSNKQQK